MDGKKKSDFTGLKKRCGSECNMFFFLSLSGKVQTCEKEKKTREVKGICGFRYIYTAYFVMCVLGLNVTWNCTYY